MKSVLLSVTIFSSILSVMTGATLAYEEPDIQCTNIDNTTRKMLAPIPVNEDVQNEFVDANKKLILAKEDYIVPFNGKRLKEEYIIPVLNWTVPDTAEFQYFKGEDGGPLCTYLRIDKRKREICFLDVDADGSFEQLSTKVSGRTKTFDVVTQPNFESMSEYYEREQSPSLLGIGIPYILKELMVTKVKKKYIEVSFFAGVGFHRKPVEKRDVDERFFTGGDRLEKVRIKATDSSPVEIAGFSIEFEKTGKKSWNIKATGAFEGVEPKLYCEGSALTVGSAFVIIGDVSIKTKSGIFVEEYNHKSGWYSNDVVISF